MTDKMIIGRYIPGNTIIHGLDSRMKMIYVFLFMILIFFCNTWSSYAFMLLTVLVIMYLAKIRFWFLIKGLTPVMLLFIFTFVMHLIVTKGGPVVLDLKLFTIEQNGIQQGAFIVLRLVLLVMISTIMTLTTSPISLTDAIESMLRPLKKIKFPVHELAMMMSISLRFIPTLMDELDRIIKAQTSRGSDVTAGSIFNRLKAIIPLLIPMFISAFKRADDLAVAMESRGYNASNQRTTYRKLKWKFKDSLALATILIIAIILYLLRN
ncbi:energy-coupling factor transporter transmembrane component T family protein [Mammaliicoccus vitulinus]|uniref:Energy-coupling factor transporter transmembrane protein EcfT n=1 Tax=Mammaliicoccus vitulinus TaxID=71237 RepID=A0ABX7HBS1_9STAP|nr:energy-coupling factor transporter transmembrane component T [Mammaliicoccus vitulinus]MBM6629073.1 energy-coupling factor transporter transmembrane protein EcfT [Mammaliicoccus vitulinus]MBO3076151.1 energy-coupling factor transporter transmembrane protein EcfT [Mammaliicoccus vitulinus]PNZ40997.1 energy-coupling factor transporter transmembrane protein EcfT [Mammaliicoccus vitulinus]PTI38141.1 energy-coupling factor transporter transmembrane protein EcfT [Mammaliicoccus vitulinus]QQT14591